jgi:hypothetical protein
LFFETQTYRSAPDAILCAVLDAVAVATFGVALAAGAFWARSYWYDDWASHGSLYLRGEWLNLTFASHRGLLTVVRMHVTVLPVPDPEKEATDRRTFHEGWKAHSLKLAGGDASGDGLTNLIRFRLRHEVESDVKEEMPAIVPPEPPVRVGMIHRTWYVATPHWAVVLPGVAWPVARYRRRARERRRRRGGLCANCGYDLRAGHARCPECGVAVERARAGQGA